MSVYWDVGLEIGYHSFKWGSGYPVVFIFRINIPIDKTIRVRYDLISQDSPGPTHFIRQRNIKTLRDSKWTNNFREKEKKRFSLVGREKPEWILGASHNQHQDVASGIVRVIYPKYGVQE